MAKRKIKQYFSDGPEEITLDSGVVVKVRPFPAGLYEKVQSHALKDFPDPPIPQKTINVLEGTEIVDDVDDPDYLAEKKGIERQRTGRLGEAVYDLCVEVLNFDKWQPMIKRLEKHQGPFPEDPDERRLEFLTSFALTTSADYKRVMTSAISQTLIEDPEVTDRMDSFRDQVERSAPADANASGVDGQERLAVS